MADGERKPLIFISYSHKDEVYKDQVLTHLGGLSLLSHLEPWHDGDIGAGEQWYEEIEEKLNGCAVAVLLISANFLSSKFCMQTEVPILLERRRRQKMMIMPILVESCFLKAVPWLNAIQMRPGKGDVIEALTKPKRNAAYARIVEEIHGFLESDDAHEVVKPIAEQAVTVRGEDNQVIQIQGNDNTIVFGSEPKADTTFPKPLAVDLTRLPMSGFDVVGRDKELQFLNEAFDGDTLNVVSLRAWGGVGKSTLVNKWCEYLATDNYRGARRVFAWSFYSQGTNERVTSADAFIDETLRFFGDDDPTAGSPWSKGERLAELVGKEKTLLILDGMEPLQDEHQGIKDPALARLVECLAETNAGLCVITTRAPVKEFSGFPETTQEVDLEHLSKEAGRALLRIKGLCATDALLEQVSESFGNHALALKLLASYLKHFVGGDVSQALAVSDLPDVAVDDGKHPRRVMAAFAEKFGEGPELDLLRVMGLFDRPADAGCIAALRKEPAIPGLTNNLSVLNQDCWRDLLDKLRSPGLLAGANLHTPEELDAHPLVREHFGVELRAQQRAAWQAGHKRLYEHLKTVPENHQPDTLAEMGPLFQAVHHGCAAGRHQEAFHDVYWPRISRKGNYYLSRGLGGIGANYGAISAFFDEFGQNPNPALCNSAKRYVIVESGINLRSLGRLREALAFHKSSLKDALKYEDWTKAAIQASSASRIHSSLGEIDKAVAFAREAIEHVGDTKGASRRSVTTRAALADALHQRGALELALAWFEEAEALQKLRQPEYPQLSGLQGYDYCQLLFTLRRARDVPDRAEYALQVVQRHAKNLADIALNDVSLGRASMILGHHEDARRQLDGAIDGLRHATRFDQIPRGLLARAALLRQEGESAKSRRDIDEAMRIATRCGMRLHECDAHLEYARLALAENNPDAALPHYQSAGALVTECGYHRRDPELLDLEEKLEL